MQENPHHLRHTARKRVELIALRTTESLKFIYPPPQLLQLGEDRFSERSE
eukprot:CAMPEP_0183345650 /NCGR_PEP_ID=MMETSP0164_2-20130417/11014_1 /TAXON_ID=221442 /ORGANISM="Coccolithus pelagicus ssp braarudi, Strain PLY182g" /LENGTH=49 /DNA_ID= /DNA_START= /DNA_END= /DNA_ORIENTATION=